MLDVLSFTDFFASLAVIAQITSLCIILALVLKTKITKKILVFFSKWGIFFAFMVALVATLGSLYYSEIAHYTPCTLCWYQRILMYPQVLLLGMAYVKKEISIASYGILFSTIGSGIALYHYLLQIGFVDELTPCSTVGYAVSCSENFGMTFGYITIPFMAFSAFVLILLLLITVRKRKV